MLRESTETPKARQFLSSVESGQLDAMMRAAGLRSSADAGWAEALDMSVARAITKQPVAVLNLIGKGFEIDALCTSPFIEPEAKLEHDYLTGAVAAVKRATVSPAVETTRAACLSRLEKLLAEPQEE